MPRRKKKQEAIIWGEVREHKDTDGFIRHHFFPRSLPYMDAVLKRYKGKKNIGIIPVEEELSFSDSQRNYHFVLLGFIAEYTGNTKDDEHHDSMIEVFGKRTFKNYKGETQEGRYSLSNASKLTLEDVNRLIERDLGVCAFLGIVVPTREELGYLPS